MCRDKILQTYQLHKDIFDFGMKGSWTVVEAPSLEPKPPLWTPGRPPEHTFEIDDNGDILCGDIVVEKGWIDARAGTRSGRRRRPVQLRSSRNA